MASAKKMFCDALNELDYDGICAAFDAGDVPLNEPLNGVGDTALLLLMKTGSDALFMMPDQTEERFRIAELLLEKGADPNIPDHYGKTPFCEATIQSDRRLGTLLLKYGADIDSEDVEQCTSINRAVCDGNTEMCYWLMAQGADASIADINFNKPADQALNIGNYGLHDDLQAYEMPPRVAIDPLLEKAELFEKDEAELCPLDSNVMWYRWGKIQAVLEEKDDLPTKNELMQFGMNGKSYFERGLECGQGEALISMVLDNGESITPEDLLDEKNKPNRLLTCMEENGLVPALFQLEVWAEQGVDAMKKVYRALPEEAQKTVGNYHRLCADIPLIARQRQQGMQMG